MATSVASTAGLVVKRAYTTIDAVLSASMQATPWVYDLLPASGREVGHLGYAVGLISTRPQDSRGKERASASLNVESEIGIRILHRLRSGAMPTDYQAALSISDVIVTVMITGADGDTGAEGPQKWRWLENRARVVADGTHVLIEQRYRVWHVSTLSL